MPVAIEKLDESIRECQRFLKRAKECRKVMKEDKARSSHWYIQPKLTGSVRRASMDLTRSLVDIRK